MYNLNKLLEISEYQRDIKEAAERLNYLLSKARSAGLRIDCVYEARTVTVSPGGPMILGPKLWVELAIPL